VQEGETGAPERIHTSLGIFRLIAAAPRAARELAISVVCGWLERARRFRLPIGHNYAWRDSARVAIAFGLLCLIALPYPPYSLQPLHTRPPETQTQNRGIRQVAAANFAMFSVQSSYCPEYAPYKPSPLSPRSSNALPRVFLLPSPMSPPSKTSRAKTPFSKRSIKPNPLLHNTDHDRERRRNLFLKKVREEGQERKWKARGGDEEVRTLESSSGDLAIWVLKCIYLGHEIHIHLRTEKVGSHTGSDCEGGIRIAR
jgi:hypothetical protein